MGDEKEILINNYLTRAQRALKGRPASDTLKAVKAIIGSNNMPPTELGKLAEEALEALRNMELPTPKQLSALETIIRLIRPVPLSFNGQLEDIDPEILPEYKYWEGFKENVKPYLYSIGRINIPPQKGVGTGFLVTENTLVTNRHVLDQISNGLRILERGQATVHFGFEYGVPETSKPVADITGVIAFHPSLDIALLEIDRQIFDAKRQPLEFSGNDEATEKGWQIATVGYPFDDSRNPLFVNALFGGKFGVKRAAIGEVLQTEENSVFHDCSTMGGNSGSPVFSMKTAKVIGLHRDGMFLYRNEAVAVGGLSLFVKENI